jgi:hypothetical protein
VSRSWRTDHQLNDTIQTQVAAFDPNVSYRYPVPVLTGHEIRSPQDSAYVTELEFDLDSGFHPNAAGQAAYAELIKEQAVLEHFGWQ